MFTIENSNIYNSNNETKNKSAKYQEKEKMKKKKNYKLFNPLNFPRYIRELCEYCT